MSEPLLVARDLEREYRVGPETVRVLRGVSMSVNPAESVALIGASGVGKSTLLHLLGGLDRPTSGQVVFAGEDLYGRSENERTVDGAGNACDLRSDAGRKSAAARSATDSGARQ